MVISLLAGCARVEYVEIYKAVRCDIIPPQKPIRSGDIVEDTKAVMIYAEQLEGALKTCIGGEDAR